jgi:hypothetical protein
MSSLLSLWPKLIGQLSLLLLGQNQSPVNNLYGSADLHASSSPSGLPASWSSLLALQITVVVPFMICTDRGLEDRWSTSRADCSLKAAWNKESNWRKKGGVSSVVYF